MRIFTVSLCLLFWVGLSAQNWTVGQPVSMLLSDLQLSSDNCWNQGQQNDDLIFFPNSLVDGVQHVYVVNSTSNGVAIGTSSAIVNQGDTIPITQPQQQFPVFFTGGAGGSLSLSVYAVGTPTMPGQAHPCQASNFWIMNFLICNTGINNNISTNCTTQLSTGVSSASEIEKNLVLPTPSNAQTLSLTNAPHDLVFEVFDITGSLLIEANTASLRKGVSLGACNEGVYLYTIKAEGISQAGKFLVRR